MTDGAGRARRGMALALALMGTGIGTGAAAQTVPTPPVPPGTNNAGVVSSQTLNRQQEQVRATPTAPSAAAGPAVTAPAANRASSTPASDARFRLTAVRFGPSRFLSREALAATASPYTGREIGFAELNAIVAAVNALYDARGLVTARAVLPPQSVTGGEVRIDLIEGRVGRVDVRGNRHLDAAAATTRAGLKADETVDVAALQHRLSLLNRVTDTQMRIELRPGAQFGLSDIQLSVIEPRRNIVQLIGDNHGYDSVGRWQGGALVRRTGLFGYSDRLTGFFELSEGARSGTASYDAPLLGDLNRFGVSYGRSRSEVTSGPFRVLESVGKTQSGSVNFSRPLASSESGLLQGSLTAGISNTRNFVAGTFIGNTLTRKGGGGLSYTYAAPGTSLALSGNAILAGAPLAGGGAGRATFGVFSGTVAGETLFSATLGVRVTGGWQVATKRGLPGDVLFQIGGATTVRGYRQGELTGDGGYYLQTEAELLPVRTAAGALTLFAFLDQGKVVTRFEQPTWLAAAGAGAEAAIGRHLSARLTAGYPLRDVGTAERQPQVFLRVGYTL